MSESGVPHADVGHRTRDEEIGAAGREDDVVYAREMTRPAELRLHIHCHPVPCVRVILGIGDEKNEGNAKVKNNVLCFVE